MHQNFLFEKVQFALSKVLNGRDLQEIKPLTKLRDDLGLDSITSLTFLMTLEEDIDGFMVDPDSLNMNDLDCVMSITDYVKRQLEKGS